MTPEMRSTLIVLCCGFLLVGVYHRVRSELPRERLDRRQEGWPILIGLRLARLMAVASVGAFLWKPDSMAWAAVSVPEALRWAGVAGFGLTVLWLAWMFVTLGRNLTDTVVTRRQATFVENGPYRYVRNPMYTGVLAMGCTLGLAFGTWLVPLLTTLVFSIIAVRTAAEERFLVARFGDQYRSYMSRVGRFFPRLGLMAK